MELEMIEFTKDRFYRVKNFAKHQNIKVKEKTSAEDKGDSTANSKVNNISNENNLKECMCM